MYRNNIVNFQESTPILNACIKMSGNLLNAPRIDIQIYDSRENPDLFLGNAIINGKNNVSIVVHRRVVNIS